MGSQPGGLHEEPQSKATLGAGGDPSFAPAAGIFFETFVGAGSSNKVRR